MLKKCVCVGGGGLVVGVVEEEGAQIMKIVPELDFLNHCMSLFLLIEDNYRILIFFM